MHKAKTNRQGKLKNLIIFRQLMWVSLITSLVIQMTGTIFTSYYNTRLVQQGPAFLNLLVEEESLREDISNLKLEIANVSSYQSVEKRAKELGFKEYGEKLFIIYKE